MIVNVLDRVRPVRRDGIDRVRVVRVHRVGMHDRVRVDDGIRVVRHRDRSRVGGHSPVDVDVDVLSRRGRRRKIWLGSRHSPLP